MKNNKLFLTIAAGLIVSTSLFQGCSKDFLEAKPKGTHFESNYYKNKQEAFNGLIAVYDVVGWTAGGYVNKLAVMNVASDDMYAGGASSTDQMHYQHMSKFSITPAEGPQDGLWAGGYAGVGRANVLLSKLPTTVMDENEKKRFVAETRFLRAYFYFDLVRMFKNIPLIIQPLAANEINDVPQVSPSEVYTFILKELKECLADLPSTVPVATEGGRITKAAGHALLGKVLLYQEQFAEAAIQFAEVNGQPGQVSQFGNQLIPNYADLFVVKNKHNKESILEVNHTNLSAGTWGCVPCTEGNLINIMSAPRGYGYDKENKAVTSQVPSFVSGWGFFIPTKELAEWMKKDARYATTISNIDSLKVLGLVNYTPSYQSTGYYLNKYAGREEDRSKGAGDADLNFPQNTYEIRLADTYLMEAEAILRGGGANSRALDLFNAVRERAHMPKKTAITLDDIINERRTELAGEGHRFFDLVRWKKAATVLAFKGFKENKNEILPIPLLELNNTILKQSKEYGGSL